MTHKLTFTLDCSENRCASAPGRFCRWYRQPLNGQAYCHLFGEVYNDDEGWSERHPECLALADTVEEVVQIIVPRAN